MKTEKQEAFIEAFCLTGNASKAAQMAGYSEKVAKQRGYKLKKQFEFEIQEQTKQMIQNAVPGALSQLTSLVDSAQSESVRLGAIKDILDRAGFKPKEVSEVEVKKTYDEEQIQRAIKEIQDKSASDGGDDGTEGKE